VREIVCWYDEEAMTWMATFEGTSQHVLKWKEPDQHRKVHLTMEKEWKTHSVSLRMIEKKRRRHPALGG
jgi:hypothetical protein